MRQIINRMIRNLVNIPGWSTNRHFIVIESDDWGSTRIRSKEDYDALTKLGFDFSDNSFYQYDGLESNDDVADLMTELSKFKDCKGNQPVFTLACNVANPDYQKIKNDKYRDYYWESFLDTLKRYPQSDKVYELELEGVNNGLFRPVFHGREHLNVLKWMKYLREGNKSVLTAAEYGLYSPMRGINGEKLGEMPAAFDIETVKDLEYLRTTISEGLSEFKRIWNLDARYFVIPNGPFNKSLEKDFMEYGVEYIIGARKQKEVLGEGKYKVHYQPFGSRNVLNQIYLSRSGFFEPGVTDNNLNVDCVDNALLSIERSFRWHKPAVLSSHRINYLGSINPKNKANGLRLLNEFLAKIIKKWPDVEFINSVELGDLIKGKENE